MRGQALSTWFLVTYRTAVAPRGDQPRQVTIRSEFSLAGDPTGADRSFEGAWLERITLPDSQFPIEKDMPGGDGGTDGNGEDDILHVAEEM